ncbi:unnamed protein product [Staurois parvus]|uniref:C2H2-type domain-containing protein n=1 Tax=Staurois parvus TaxID=386267 RepID=A0ABN9G0B0_9NEOB|nr:unnamed protein product [Staurois parvus]
MVDLGGLRCHNCNMMFRSPSLLEKHRQKFCIGSQIGDPAVLRSRYVSSRGHTPLPRQADTPPTSRHERASPV